MTEEDAGRTAASSRAGEKRRPDPYGLYRRWFDAFGDARSGAAEGAVGAVGSAASEELWKRWFETMVMSRGGVEEAENHFSGAMASLWSEMAEDASAEILSDGGLPEDPLRSFVRWYNDTEERWSEEANEFLRKDEVLEQAGRSLEGYARSYAESRRVSEEGLKMFRLPTSSDVARVARLVVVVENKVDRIEEAFEEFVYGDDEPATAEAVGSLQERMDRLEGKMDRVLAALERIETGKEPGPEVAPRPFLKRGRYAAGAPGVSSNEVRSLGANGPGYS